MRDICGIFNGVDDPRRSNATRHDLQEMLVIAFLCFLSGGQDRADMERYGCMKEGFLREFMTPGHGIPGRDAFPGLSTRPVRTGFTASSPGCRPAGGNGSAT